MPSIHGSSTYGIELFDHAMKFQQCLPFAVLKNKNKKPQQCLNNKKTANWNPFARSTYLDYLESLIRDMGIESKDVFPTSMFSFRYQIICWRWRIMAAEWEVSKGISNERSKSTSYKRHKIQEATAMIPNEMVILEIMPAAADAVSVSVTVGWIVTGATEGA
mmetsp:Transcript_37278/g.77359  ORF Transcript_37278/g.77359 Transcript_37278/m.77359 type:complete len:162 (-) Transcript_37278:221-706(-)|eukprot:CAMPEP_0172461226 /NCGR_PEP_ID=MMETSP1065-20121228/39715_1 /TAXON_ID=265537 /ORGANISM="Amphiprora paludosa, Strain CCMP125" /LENGTH=161 /DNA_ID=CAMNT_0013216477 /DNA_START=79 /DNA_END=564 /DNA_ORIENTATION=-